MQKIPHHIVLFPDGNRRWAQKNHLTISEGYLKGKDKFHDFLRWAKQAGVSVVTVFGFSSENWNRPQDQVAFLMQIFETYLKEGIKSFNAEGVKVKIIGQKKRLSESLQHVITEVEQATKDNTTLQLNLAVSYGGRWDILQATQTLIGEGINPENITEEIFAQKLSTAGLPEPDLIIRAGGEMRLSNFLLWQGAYAELYFSDTLWPEFEVSDFEKALKEFDRRQRRFGS